MDHVLIVGAGHAGAAAAIALSAGGYPGRVTLAGDEPDPPYERPPLSKDYLAGAKAFDRLLLRPANFWAERGITHLPATRITALDPATRTATAHDGRDLPYTHLVWATGGTPRRLTCDGHALGGIHTVRARADVDALRAELPAARHIVIVGGGYIGLEAAAVLTTLGHHVTVLEAAPRLLARVAAGPLADFYLAEHRARGVTIHLATTAACIEGSTRARSVLLCNGARLPADLVITGIGIEPAVAPLRAAGATGTNGIDVDEYCRTSLPDTYAIGDCAAHVSVHTGTRIRVESVQNAHDMATVAARAILGGPVPYTALPWFWSNQYDLRLQTIGLAHGHDATLLRGDPATRAFTLAYLCEGRVIALDCVNTPRDYAQGRALILDRARPAAAALADPAIPLKALTVPG